MLDPFDTPTGDAYRQTRFTDSMSGERDNAYALLDATLSASARITAAKRAEQYRQRRLEEEREYQEEQARLAREAAAAGRPSGSPGGSSTLGTVASAVGTVGSVVGVVAAI